MQTPERMRRPTRRPGWSEWSPWSPTAPRSARWSARRSPGSRPRSYASRTTRTGTAWDAALTAAVAAHRRGPRGLRGLQPAARTASSSTRFAGRVLNSHPALLPSFPGLHAARDALAHGVKVTGATLFLVDAGTDTGPIVAQVGRPGARRGHRGPVLHERIKQAERVMLPQQLARLVTRGFSIEGREVRVG